MGPFFSKPHFFLHFSSSNVVQSVWRAQGSIWRCSNRESFLIDKLFSIGPWYDFIEECEWAENSTTRDFERNCCHFPFYGFSFWIYWGQMKACKMGLSQMHPWIWFFKIKFVLAINQLYRGSGIWYFFKTKCLFFFVKNTFLGMILNWGEFLLTSPIYRGSRLYNAGSGHSAMNIFGQIFPLCAETQTFRADTFIFLSQPLTSRSILCNKKEYKHNVDTNVDVDVICI